MGLAADLHAQQELGQPVGHAPVAGIARRRVGLVQAQEGEVAGVEQIGRGIAVLLDERRLVGAVFGVGLGRAELAQLQGRDLLADRPAGVLAFFHVIGQALQPGPVLRPVLDADQPGQGEHHAPPLLLDAVGPIPAVGIGGHHGADRAAGPLQQRLEAGLVVEPQVRGPDPALVVRGVMHGPGLPEGAPAALAHLVPVEGRPAIAENARGAIVAEDVLQQGLVPAVVVEHGGRAQAAEDDLHVVVGVQGACVAGPVDQAEVALGRVVLEEPGVEVDPVEQARRDLAASGIAVESRAQGKGQAGLAVGVAAQPPAHGLLAVVADLGAEALEDAEPAVAARDLAGRGRDERQRIGPRRVPVFLVLLACSGVEQHARRGVPVDAAHDGPACGVGRERLVARVARADRGLPIHRRRLGARLEPAEDHAPYGLDGVLGRVARGDELAELRGANENPPRPVLEEDRMDLDVGESEHGRIEAGHLGRHEVGVGRGGLHEMAVVQGEDAHFGQRRAEGIAGHDHPLQRGPPRGRDLQIAQGGRILDVEAQSLAGRFVEDLGRQGRGLVRVTVGEDEHACAWPGGAHGLDRRPAARVRPMARCQDAVQVVVLGTREDETGVLRVRGRRAAGSGERGQRNEAGHEQGPPSLQHAITHGAVHCSLRRYSPTLRGRRHCESRPVAASTRPGRLRLLERQRARA